MPFEWDLFYAWMDAQFPRSELLLPLADFECSSCGNLDCDGCVTDD